jgi:hypothetical protein
MIHKAFETLFNAPFLNLEGMELDSSTSREKPLLFLEGKPTLVNGRPNNNIVSA